MVTGAGGFIGSALVERLVADGAHVRGNAALHLRGQRGCLDDIPGDVMREVDITLGDVRDLDAFARSHAVRTRYFTSPR